LAPLGLAPLALALALAWAPPPPCWCHCVAAAAAASAPLQPQPAIIKEKVPLFIGDFPSMEEIAAIVRLFYGINDQRGIFLEIKSTIGAISVTSSLRRKITVSLPLMLSQYVISSANWLPNLHRSF
jgi:hypothetical protein